MYKISTKIQQQITHAIKHSRIQVILQPSAEFLNHGVLPCGVVAGEDVAAGFADKPEVEAQVVDGAYLQAQNLLSTNEMVEVGEGLDAVDFGGGGGVNGFEAAFPVLVLDIDGAFGGE